MAAHAVAITCSFCPVSWASQNHESTLVTYWPIRSTHLKCRLSTGCQIRAPTPLSMPQSTLLLTRLVSGPICLFLYFCGSILFYFHLLFLISFIRFILYFCVAALSFMHSYNTFITLIPLRAHNAQRVN